MCDRAVLGQGAQRGAGLFLRAHIGIDIHVGMCIHLLPTCSCCEHLVYRFPVCWFRPKFRHRATFLIQDITWYGGKTVLSKICSFLSTEELTCKHACMSCVNTCTSSHECMHACMHACCQIGRQTYIRRTDLDTLSKPAGRRYAVASKAATQRSLPRKWQSVSPGRSKV